MVGTLKEGENGPRVRARASVATLRMFEVISPEQSCWNDSIMGFNRSSLVYNDDDDDDDDNNDDDDNV